MSVLGSAGGVFLGGVFLLATISKVVDPVAFQELVELEGLDFLAPSWFVAPFAIALEGAIGLALLLGVRRLWVLVPSAALVLFFMFLTGRAYYLSVHGTEDPAASCGCFGNLVERTPAEAFWQDLLMLGPPLVLAFLGRIESPALPLRRLALVGAFIVALLVMGGVAPDMDLDDFATRLKPGKNVSELCAGQGLDRLCVGTLLPESTEGEHIVIIAKLDDETFAAEVPRLNEFVMSGTMTMLWLMCDATQEEKDVWYWTNAPSFEVRTAPHALLRPLYRRLPRSFRIRDGVVTDTYDGIPPLELDSEER
jgi:uncharacterized membrane protein YphA (DoxX/SURF4 family)